MDKLDIKKALEDFGSKYSYWLTSSGSGESEAYHNKCDAEDPILTYVTALERERNELKEKINNTDDTVYQELCTFASQQISWGESHIDYDNFMPYCKEQFIVLRNPDYKP